VPSCVALLPPSDRQTKQATGWRVSQHVNEDVAVLGQVAEVGGKIRRGSVAGLPVRALSCDLARLRQSQDDAPKNAGHRFADEGAPSAVSCQYPQRPQFDGIEPEILGA
jgi:hypothetical protein